jgi:pyruvate formate lyase activating enzyme
VIASTYNEPLITSEWAVEVFRVAKAAGLRTAYISNGNGTPEVLAYLRPWVDYYKVDLKGFSQEEYRKLGGQLAGVLETIKRLVAMGFWVEVVTLIIPGFNDSEQELQAMTEFLASVSTDMPWHVTAFHKDYKMLEPANTTAKSLIRAAEIGQRSGLRFVYAGNLPGQVGPYEHTYCPDCRTAVVQRLGYRILETVLKDGACGKCGRRIPGVWN